MVVFDPSIELIELVKLTKFNHLPLSLAFQFSVLLHFGLLNLVDRRFDCILPILLRICLYSLIECRSEFEMAQFLFGGCGVPRPELHQVLNVFVYLLIKRNQELANVKILGFQWNARLRFLV